jgi:hypothetical protein
VISCFPLLSLCSSGILGVCEAASFIVADIWDNLAPGSISSNRAVVFARLLGIGLLAPGSGTPGSGCDFGVREEPAPPSYIGQLSDHVARSIV